ncbi:hypothetical protein [Flavobacterium sp.]|uniref:hypothetical protein n=1 Tax=Flavobacterium sp. TaxID=239 RepID=UPI0031D98EF0
MEINTESSKFFLRKSSKLLNFIFPGIVIIDLFFKKGFFSNEIDSLYTFILYIIWALILSIPFHFFNHSLLENLTKHLLKNVGIKRKHSPEEIKKIYESLTEEDKEDFEEFQDGALLGLIIIKTIILYLTYKIFIYYKIVHFTIIDIPLDYLNFICVTLSTIIMSYPLGYVYAKFCLHRLEYLCEEEFFQ